MGDILSSIFSSKTIDRALDGIDASILTPEERLKYHMDMLKSYEPFKLIQRVLALWIVVPYILVWLSSAGLFVYGSILAKPMDAESAVVSNIFISTSLKLGEMNNDTLGAAVAIILSLYFAGGMANGWFEKWSKK